MDTMQKLDLLSAGAREDLASATGDEGCSIRHDVISRWIYPAVREDGRPIKLLKILQTNACERDCFYCATRRARNTPRTTFQPEELARTFDELHRARLAEGIFISSAVAGGGTRTMERMLATAELLRTKFQFRGYMHLKLMPGAEAGAIERALALGDRVSINLEAPSSAYLARLSATKHYVEELMAPLQTAREIVKANPALARKTMTTQFVVGAAGEADRDLAARADQLYRTLKLARVYYSAFQPVEETPLENQAPTPRLRQTRLYQSDFLLRRYGFSLQDLIFDQDGNLPIGADPKSLWAEHHPEFFPLEVNRASPEELMRIPGIGPLSAARIVQARRNRRFSSIEQLARTGADSTKAAPFILLEGRPPARQLALW